jgi:transcriptional regulator with XRE-family HTH domain
MDSVKIGEFLKVLRKSKGYTQEEVAKHLYVTQKTVSRWENGEALPDAMLLLDLSKSLHVSVDLILAAGNLECNFERTEKFNVLDVPKGFEAIESVKKYFGEKSLFYIGMIQGISKIMNFDFEEALEKNRSVLYKEVIISALNMGYYVDKEEVEELFKDNYKTYEFIKSYDNDYWKKNLQLNLAKHGCQ